MSDRSRNALMLIFFVVFLGVESYAGDSILDLKKALELDSDADVHRALNNVRQVSLSQKDIVFLEKIYLEPELFTDINLVSLAKIGALNILLQAKKNGFDISSEVISSGYALAVSNLQVSNEYVFRLSVNSLSLYDRPESFPLLVALAEEQKPKRFRALVMGMISMCSSYDSKTFDEFLKKLSPKNRNSAEKMKDDFMAFSEASGWCQ